MGEAKTRRQFLAIGQPSRRDLDRCPTCFSFHTVKAPIESNDPETRTTFAGCMDCGALWEAFPPDWSHDAVEAEPCDNCAFRPGSAEIADREGWRDLLAKLKAGSEFKCHKGAPIRFDPDALTREFDEEWIRTKGRTCAGFLRAIQHWPGWLEAHFGIAPPASEPQKVEE